MGVEPARRGLSTDPSSPKAPRDRLSRHIRPCPGKRSSSTRSYWPGAAPPRDTAGQPGADLLLAAVLGLRWFRDRSGPDALARDHSISRATSYGHRDEAPRSRTTSPACSRRSTHWTGRTRPIRAACLYLVTRSLDLTGRGRARWAMRWLSRHGARCRHCCRSVSPCRSPSEVDRRRGALGRVLFRRSLPEQGLRVSPHPALQ
jgi:hypothetical protein